MFKEAESRPDKIESTSNNAQVRKKQQHRRRARDPPASLKRFTGQTLGYLCAQIDPFGIKHKINTIRQREQISFCNALIIAMVPLVTLSDVTDIMARVNENTMVFY